MTNYIGAIDQGTSSSRFKNDSEINLISICHFCRFMVFESGTGKVVAEHQIEVEQLFPHERCERLLLQVYKISSFFSWVEQRPDELLSSVEACVEAVTDKLRGQGLGLERLAGVGITNQRETTILWHRGTGRPLYNAVVWCDARYTRG